MYEPKFVYTNEMINDLMELTSIKEKLSSLKLPTREKQKLIYDAKLKKTHFSTSIEGNILSYDQVAKVIENKSQNTHVNAEKEVINYWNALEFLENNLNKETLDLDFILELHSIIVNAGKPKKSTLRSAMPPGTLFAIYDSKTHAVDYIPPEYSEVPQLLSDLLDWYNNDNSIIAPVKAAIFSYQFLTIHPFVDGNGRTARALASYILMKNDYDYNGFGSMEEFYTNDINGYYENLQMDLPALYYEGRNDPPHLEKWIGYFIHILKLNAESIFELAQKVNIIKDRNPLIENLSRREKLLLRFILENNKDTVKTKDVAELFHISTKTARKWLTELCEDGFLKPNKVNVRVTSYNLSNDYQELSLMELGYI